MAGHLQSFSSLKPAFIWQTTSLQSDLPPSNEQLMDRTKSPIFIFWHNIKEICRYCLYFTTLKQNILRGRWMLESDWLTNVLRCAIIFMETHGERSSRQLSWPHYSSVSLRLMLFQRSHNRKITKTHNDTGQTNKYSKQKDKIDRSCPCFCHKITFYYVRKAHSLLSLSPTLGLSLTDTHIVCTHLNISANVVSTTLTILSVTWLKNLKTTWLLPSDVS